MQGRWTRTGRSAAVWRIAAAYALLACFAGALAFVLRDGAPWVHPDPWMSATPLTATLTSALCGIGTAAIVVVSTRVAVGRFAWAQRLHAELRPVAQDLTVGQIFLLAGLSSLGEEILFRGLMTPALGVIGSSVLFGVLHQVRGPSRWVWIAWATAVGLVLGTIFAATGSLVGPLLAHAVVNAVNLGYLRDHDPEANGRAERVV
ncbi:MAG: CPBP family intramembrane metalloprotease [Polyangiaceae bacterium]|nr:CPBP family intramembrane metalloprotease [Polyangiaceae bacterium]